MLEPEQNQQNSEAANAAAMGTEVSTQATGAESATVEAGAEASEAGEQQQQQSSADTTNVAEAGETKAAAEKPTIKFSDFDKITNPNAPTIEPVKPEPVKKSNARDYSGIAEADLPGFKEMGNRGFQLARTQYLENQQLKKDLAEAKTKTTPQQVQVFDHPEGYTLTPEFKQQSVRNNLATQIQRHYMTQLARAQQGHKWQDCDIDPKTGALLVSKEDQEPSPEHIAALTMFVQQSTQTAYVEQQKLNELGSKLQGGYQQAVSAVESAIQQYYKPLLDPKHPTAELQKKTMELVPAEFKAHPMSKLFVLTLAENARINGENKKMLAELATLKANKVDASKAQPTKASFVTGASNGKAPIKYSEMQALLAGR